ncbi:MAG: hypothetical protein JZU52_20755 [Lamprocystis purpurea]|jgi:hypothetical protein|uniref:hypothetical protein n=1 Tax=Lamprocystis purpurea TaxID=61598 RepID=UPI0003A5CA8D|nr:hypothetical protein [Lamprocystis purpurea]MBV5275962.1 hypothetical protein [Lamprocystis purpurea]
MATRKGAVSSFSRPTVLDSEPCAAFIPAPLLPGNRSYGYTLDFAEAGVPDNFTPELLTFPIDSQPEPIKALGFIFGIPHRSTIWLFQPFQQSLEYLVRIDRLGDMVVHAGSDALLRLGNAGL